MRRHSPPPSANLYFLSFGFAFSISLIVSATADLQSGGIFLSPHFASSYPTSFPTEKSGCTWTPSHALARYFLVSYCKIITSSRARMSWEVRGSSGLECFGCPPGIRTPIDRFRADCPTIERGGNGSKGTYPYCRFQEPRALHNTLTASSLKCTGACPVGQRAELKPHRCSHR